MMPSLFNIWFPSVPRVGLPAHIGQRLLHAGATLFGVISCLGVVLAPATCGATPASSPEIAARRGKVFLGEGTSKPVLKLDKPSGGWTSNYMLSIEGTCSDKSVDPVSAAINGVRYYIRSKDGAFSRKFPAARGQNTITVECANKGGVASETRTITGVMATVPLKVVLTSDTDGVYTDLHMYEPDGQHVYWASTNSKSGGLFFLNQQDDSIDEPGYGPYLYVHPAPPVGVYRIDTNYWPGGAVQHTLATLDIVTNEGLPNESRRRVRRPLARPGETQTLAYVVVRANGLPVQLFVPGQDDPKQIPEEVLKYQREVETKIKSDDYAYLPQSEERVVRENVARIALAQAQSASPRWQPEQRDCAGLVRFAYREALAPRTDRQIEEIFRRHVSLPAMRYPVGLFIPAYPKLWITGYDRAGRSSTGYFADAESLLGYNFRKKGRDLSAAQVGDILAFQKDVGADSPFHLMLFGGPDPVRGVVVYHTGSEPERIPYRPGHVSKRPLPSVRVVGTVDLMKSVDPTWMPVPANQHFLGVFEWKQFRPHPYGAGSV